ncbi:MAG: hypothetical protein MH112_02110 [Phenylobacterium sp.]|uniref:LamG-like jellyroll fold domain-containing protein n=1 Tax=Phenylobacterium sp. TaxID=1871053 RepID=UPI0025CB83E1|nr:LamG-like jellyroll fold domain-containing protein [Phenylobacterium sp.]MCG9915139.1 hypothetical protein [Phenylobacterium sp.]
MAAKVSGYGDRPGFKADAVVATQATHALSQRLNHLHAIDTLQRVGSLVDVTLNVTEALGGTLEEMKGLAIRLQDNSLGADQRQILASEFDTLNARIDDITKAASFAGRNLLNPDAADQTGDITLPSGTQITAHDLRKGQGAILPLSVPIEAPLLNDLGAAFAFEGNFTPAALGPHSHTRVRSFAPVTYTDGENSNLSIQASYTGLSFSPTAGATVSASIRPNQPGAIIQHIVSGDLRDAVTVSLNSSNRIVASGTSTITGPVVNLGEWIRISISVSESGNASVFLNDSLLGNIQYRVGLPTIRNDITLFGGTNSQIDNLSIYKRALNSNEISTVNAQSENGVQNWRPTPPGGSDWGMVHSDISQSLSNLRNIEAYYGSVGRNINSDVTMQQRMTDIVDTGMTRLVVPDLNRLSAAQTAAQVHAQLVQAMMGNKKNLMSQASLLFTSALNNFDRMNISGFTPSRLRL